MAALVFLVVVALLFLLATVDRWLPRRRRPRRSGTPEPPAGLTVRPYPDPADPADTRDPDPAPSTPATPPAAATAASPAPPAPPGDGAALSDEGRLVGRLLDGAMCPAEYRLAMAELAFEEDLRRPLVVPPDMHGT